MICLQIDLEATSMLFLALIGLSFFLAGTDFCCLSLLAGVGSFLPDSFEK